MATPEEIKRQQTLNNLQKENVSYTQQQTRANRENADISNGLIDDLKETLGIRQRYSQNEASILKLNKDINASIDRQKVGLSSVKQISNQVKKNEELINKAKAQANSLTKGLADEQKDLVKLIKAEEAALKKANIEQENLLASAQEGAVIDENRLNELKDKIALHEKEVNAGREMLGYAGNLALITEQQIQQLEEANELREQELEKIKKIEGAFGFAGKAAKALGELPVVGSAFTKALSGAQDRVKELVEETGELPSRMKRAKIFAQEFAGVVQKAALGFLVKQALNLNKGLVDVGRTLGIARSEIREINQALRDTEASTGNVFTTDSERLAVLNRISKTLGVNARLLGDENVAGAARLEQSLGLAAESADGLASLSAISGTNILQASDNTFDLTNEFNKTNRTLINANSVLEEVGKTSKSIGAIFAFNTQELAEATLQAKKLGLTLNDVSGIADQLLNFEDSITSELEAELLIGQDLTLEKARQLALNNDLKGLGEELTNQGITTAKFASMNRIQQEAVAKALGMSSEQMGQMLYQQELNNLGAEKFDALYGEQNRKAAEQLTVQQNLEKSLARLAEAATPFIELIATLLSNTKVIYATIGLLAVGQIPKLLSGLKSAGVAMRAIGMASKISLLSTVGTALFANPLGALAAAAALAGTIALVKNATKVEDGIAPSSKGPFTITDRFGATAVTTQGDGLAVSPNINQQPAGMGMGEVVQELRQVKSVLNKILEKEGSVYIDSTKAGTAFAVGTSKLQ